MKRRLDSSIATLTLMTLCGLLAAVPALAYDCDHTAPLEAIADAAGAERVVIDAKAGYLKVVGRSGLGEVRASGEACASSASLLKDIELTARRSGDRVRVVVEIPDSRWGRSTARLDLTVEVPAELLVKIDDGSGDISVRDVAAADIDDGSGEIVVEDVLGDLRIDDGSGEINIQGVGGKVTINDGSGEIDIRRSGSVMIDEDGSGSIDIEEIEGDVVVRDDGSGSIDVSDIGGDFTVYDDGSGGIRHKAVSGQVRVPDDD